MALQQPLTCPGRTYYSKMQLAAMDPFLDFWNLMQVVALCAAPRG